MHYLWVSDPILISNIIFVGDRLEHSIIWEIHLSMTGQKLVGEMGS